MTYCRNSGLFASLSHDQLLVFSEAALVREKLLKCSTSSFADCAFSLSGNTLATVFADGSIFLWDTEDYSHRESGLAYRGLRVALNAGSTVAVFNGEKLFLADLSKETVIYQEIDKFWKGQVKQVGFLEGSVVVNTDCNFYLADIQLEHQFIIKGVREFAETDEFALAEYQSVLVLITNKLKTITIARLTKGLS
jgi:WD40 repeat protein